MWSALTAAGDVQPAGLGARDTLRLEMGMALYGNDIDEGVTPYEANLGWIVKLAKGDFVGRDALVAAEGGGHSAPPRRLHLRRARDPAARLSRSSWTASPAAQVRSGTMSPTLGIPVGTAYVPPSHTAEGSTFEVEIRGRRVPARVVKPPFYKDASHR